jgi:single-stranded DNA-binding protein
MKHNSISQGLIADVVDAVKVQNVNGKQVARFQLAFVKEKKGDNGSVQHFRNKFFAEAWGDTGKFIQSLPVGTTIMFSGEFQNYSYDDGNGGKKYGTKVIIFGVGSCGMSQYPPEQQRTAPQAGGYQQQGYQQPPMQAQTGYNQQAYNQAPPPHNYAPGAQNPPTQHAPPQNAYGQAPVPNGQWQQNPPPMQGQAPMQQTGSFPPPAFDPNEQIPF